MIRHPLLMALLRSPSGRIGLGLVLFHCGLALIAPLIVPYDFNAQSEVLDAMGPSLQHWAGLVGLSPAEILTSVRLQVKFSDSAVGSPIELDLQP